LARGQRNAPRVGLVGLQSDFQGSSATVTNPGFNPVETNAKLRGYHRECQPVNKPSTKHQRRRQ